MPWQALVQMEEILFMADRNLKARPPAWRPPPQHLEAAAAYHIIVSICQMMAMVAAGLLLFFLFRCFLPHDQEDNDDEEEDATVMYPERSLIDVDGRRNLSTESALLDCPY